MYYRIYFYQYLPKYLIINRDIDHFIIKIMHIY